GWFQIDNEAFRSLDAQRGTSTGSVKVTFDARAFPITIEANVKTGDAAGSWFDVRVTHQHDGSGDVVVTALGDVDDPKDGTDENGDLNSRWDATGAGRADVRISGGNVPSTTTVLASECWSDAFARTYYTDNVSYRPTTGDASSCV